MNQPRFGLARYTVILIVAAFILVTSNLTFIGKVTELYPFSKNIGFVVALCILIFSLTVLTVVILSILLPVRTLGAILIFSAAISAYFSDTFGTVIDTDMLRNILETDVSEAIDLLSWSMIFRFFLFAVLPVFVLYHLPLKKERLLQIHLRSGLMGITALGLSAICILSNGSQFATFFRQHKSVRYYVNPGYPIYSVGRYISDSLNGSKSKELILLNTEVWKRDTVNKKNKLVIMVVGETARADHFSLNGYKRNTNEFTDQEPQLISYSNVSACGTSTAVSVPCMFSFQGREGFNVKEGRRTENVLDLLQRAGVNVLWRDNNSDSKGMAERIPYEDFRSDVNNTQCDIECRDTGMLDNLQDYISKQSGDVLIVLHQMGSHGPAYFKRYPKEFERYQPACNTSELAECSQQEIINAYDNSIRYTDYFLSKVIALLKENTSHDTTMLYVSDHGESLGEAGIYLHGLPYSFAPQTQTNVPILLWSKANTRIDFPATHQLKDEKNSHDSVFSTLLLLFDVKTSLSPSNGSPLVLLDVEIDSQFTKR